MQHLIPSICHASFFCMLLGVDPANELVHLLQSVCLAHLQKCNPFSLSHVFGGPNGRLSLDTRPRVCHRKSGNHGKSVTESQIIAENESQKVR